jgi:hypothetical protein
MSTLGFGVSASVLADAWQFSFCFSVCVLRMFDIRYRIGDDTGFCLYWSLCSF